MTSEVYDDLYWKFCEIETQPMSCVDELLTTLQEGKDYDFVREQQHPWMEPEFKEDTKVMFRVYKFYIDGADKPEYISFLYGDNTKILGVALPWECNIQQPWDY